MQALGAARGIVQSRRLYQRREDSGMKRTRLTVQDRAKAKGLNITTFSRVAELAPGTARAYWYGDVNLFDGDVLERIAKALGTDVPGLFEPIEVPALEEAVSAAS